MTLLQTLPTAEFHGQAGQGRIEPNSLRLLASLESMAEVGGQEDGSVCRRGFTPADRQGRELFSSWLLEAGLTVRVDAAGNVAVAPMDVAAFSSPKLHIVAAGTTSGTALCAWSDRRVDGGDIRAQSLNPDGSLRPNPAAVVLLTGCGNNPAGSLTTSGRPAVGAAMSIGVDNPLGTQAPGSLAFLAYSFVPNSGPCGLPGAGMGMGGAGAVGDILVDQSTLSTTFGGNWSGPLAPVQFALLVPPTPALYGVSLVAQGALFDPTPGASVGIGLTQALLLTIGS